MQPSDSLRAGISVLVATSGGASHIRHALASLARQVLEPDEWEAVIVVNGRDDGTIDIINRFRQTYPQFTVHLLYTPEQGVSNAHNIALRMSTRQFFTILDDDDWLSPGYLSELLAGCSPGKIVAAFMVDVDPSEPETRLSFDNYINRGVAPVMGRTVSWQNASALLSADAGKAAETRLGRDLEYDDRVGSGQDVVFWTGLAVSYDLDVQVLPITSRAFYYRLLREGSVSRFMSGEWADDRVRVIIALQHLRDNHPQARAITTGKMMSQARALGNYVHEHPEAYVEYAERIRDIDPGLLVALNETAARLLVLCYLFPPYEDASAVVAARRLLAWGRPYNVVQQEAGDIRRREESLNRLTSSLKGRSWVVGGGSSWADPTSMARFCKDAYAKVSDPDGTVSGYDSIYSRAMWPFSHALGALIKARNPGIRWVAEFSDPMSLDATGGPRIGNVGDTWLTEELTAASQVRGFSPPEDSIFGWLESLTFVLADEIIFTNDNQREVMVRGCASAGLAERVMSNSRILPQPVPEDWCYQVSPARYPVDSAKTNIGYFGRFYESRSVGDIVDAIGQLNQRELSSVAMHLFIPESQLEETSEYLRTRGLVDQVAVACLVPYFDYLATVNQMDWVVVADARVTQYFGLNPFLPSKAADYAGSRAQVWGLVEPGSPLADSALDHVTDLGAAENVRYSLKWILSQGNNRRVHSCPALERRLGVRASAPAVQANL